MFCHTHCLSSTLFPSCTPSIPIVGWDLDLLCHTPGNANFFPFNFILSLYACTHTSCSLGWTLHTYSFTPFPTLPMSLHTKRKSICCPLKAMPGFVCVTPSWSHGHLIIASCLLVACLALLMLFGNLAHLTLGVWFVFPVPPSYAFSGCLPVPPCLVMEQAGHGDIDSLLISHLYLSLFVTCFFSWEWSAPGETGRTGHTPHHCTQHAFLHLSSYFFFFPQIVKVKGWTQIKWGSGVSSSPPSACSMPVHLPNLTAPVLLMHTCTHHLPLAYPTYP